MTLATLFFLLLASAALYTMAAGGMPERLTTGLFIVAAVLTPLAENGAGPGGGGYAHLQLGVLLIDAALYAALLCLAAYSARFWPVWMSAMQGAEVLAHLLGVTGVPRMNLTYAIMVQAWSYPMIGLLVIATWRHQRRLKKDGDDPSWSFSSSRRSASALETPLLG
jgi:hypothetical protein